MAEKANKLGPCLNSRPKEILMKQAAVLFDLDGTLVDTAADLIAALNLLCVEKHHPAPSQESTRPLVSDGALGLVQHAFPKIPQEEAYLLKDRFRELYGENICVHSSLFPHMEELLLQLEKAHIIWGIVTNKPEHLSKLLLEKLNLYSRTACLVGGDTTAYAKPHPRPLQYAAELLQVPVQNCIYVGDARRDIQAGHAAGMKTIAALYGYIGVNEDPKDWHADFSVDHASEIWSRIESWLSL